MHLSFQISYLAVCIISYQVRACNMCVLLDIRYRLYQRFGGVVLFAAFPRSHSFSVTTLCVEATSKSYKRIVFLKMHRCQISDFESFDRHLPLLLLPCFGWPNCQTIRSLTHRGVRANLSTKPDNSNERMIVVMAHYYNFSIKKEKIKTCMN